MTNDNTVSLPHAVEETQALKYARVRLNVCVVDSDALSNYLSELLRDDAGYVDQGFYVRPATKGDEGRTYHASWGGECTFLKETGCSLSHNERPLECRTLEPKYPLRCEQHHGKHATAIAWLPYHTLLEELVRDAMASL